MDNAGTNYGQRGDELWTTRGRTMDNAGTNYGQRGEVRDMSFCASPFALEFPDRIVLELPSWISR